MKVDADLRQAIKAVAVSAKKSRYDRDARTKAQSIAIRKFCATSMHAKGVKVALAKIKAANAKARAADKEESDAQKVLASVGLRAYTEYKQTEVRLDIKDEEVFADCGGVIDARYSTSWDTEQVVAELVAAPEKDKTAILKKYGIIWG